jgi:hypothetical protein
MDAARHEVMAPVAQHADELGCQGVIEKRQHHVAIGGVAHGDGAFIDVLPGAHAQGRDVGENRRAVHGELRAFRKWHEFAQVQFESKQRATFELTLTPWLAQVGAVSHTPTPSARKAPVMERASRPFWPAAR